MTTSSKHTNEVVWYSEVCPNQKKNYIHILLLPNISSNSFQCDGNIIKGDIINGVTSSS